MINLILKMMESEALKTVFLKLANMSISASWLVLIILLLRVILKKAPKWVNVLLWGIVAVRLICPFSIESALSLIPSAETIPMNIELDSTPAIDSGINAVNSVVNPMITASFTPHPGASANPLQIWIPLAAVIWFLGMVLMMLYMAISYWRLRRKVDTAVRYKDNIFQSENVGSPFVLGILKPRIYLPFAINERDLDHVVAHEQAHIRRKDHWWKPLGYLLLMVHWFNPLMWLAYVLLCRDIELACDEKVIQKLDNEQRADYTQALVACSVNRRMIAACPLAFGEVGVKERVKSVMNYKRPAFWIILIAVIVCVIVAICFLTDPIQDKNSESFLNYKKSISLSERQDVIPAIHYSSVNDQGSIGIGMVEGNDFAIYLDTAKWTEKWFTPSDLSSPGSVSVNVADNLRFSIYDRNYAAVEFNNEICYYRTAADDYEILLGMLMPADEERLENSAETRLDLALGVATIEENTVKTPSETVFYTDKNTNGTYHLTIPVNGITKIDTIIGNESGSVEPADGMPFEKGEKVHLEKLDKYHDLSGLVINGFGEGEIILFSLSIPEGPHVDPITAVYADGWILTREGFSINNAEPWSESPGRKKVEDYLLDYTYDQVKSRMEKSDISVLILADHYGLVYASGEGPELILYHFTHSNISNEINIIGIARGDYAISDELLINHLQIDNQHIYFGTVSQLHWNPIDESTQPLRHISMRFISEDGEILESSFENESIYLTAMNAPLSNFEIMDTENNVLLNLETCLDQGYVIQEKSMMIAALGTNGTRGFVKAEDLDGDLPSNPEEAIAYMEEMERKTAYGTKKYVRLIPLYAEDGVTVIGEFAIG